MNTDFLGFLSSATIEDVAEITKPSRKGVGLKERNPQGLAIRLFKDGSIYPSQQLVDKFFLEYAGKDVEHGYGFDVVDTDLFPSFKAGVRMLIISAVKKSEPKVDIFGSTSYIKEGENAGDPVVSVMQQGAKTYGKDDLIPMVEEIYGTRFNAAAVEASTDENGRVNPEVPAITDGVDYLDLAFVANPATGEAFVGKDVTFLPKKISRGKDKGNVTTQRRERPLFYALLPVSAIADPGQQNGQSLENETATLNEAPVTKSPEVADLVEA